MKKSILMAILAILTLALSVSMVSAAVTVQSTFSSSSPTFGDSSQMASNPNADAEADENIYDTGDVTLNSTAAVTVSSITVTPASGFSLTDLNITLNDVDLSLAAGVPEAITLSARIPEQLDAVNSDLQEVAFKVATVTFTFSDSTTASFDAYMQRKNMLDFKKLEITVADGDTDSYDDGDKVKDVKPGDNIQMDFKAKNLYDESDDDVTIEDVEAAVLIDNNDLDIDESESLGDLDAEETGDATISFTTDEEASDDTYDMEVTVEGDDEHGAKHGVKYALDFTVERKSHDIIIKTASLEASSVSCTRGENSIQIKLSNIGKDDEDEVSLYVTNKELGLKFEQTDITVDQDESFSKTITFTVPDSLVAGTYPVRVSAYYSGNDEDGILADLKDVDLVVSKCETATTTPTTPTNVEVTESGGEEVTVPSEVMDEFGITETEESKPFTESTAFVVLLIAAVAVLLIAVVVMTVLLFRRPIE